MNLNTFNRWLMGLCKSMYQDGFKDGESEFDDCSILTEERLMEIMLSVKGIGRNRAEQVIDLILNEGADNGSET